MSLGKLLSRHRAVTGRHLRQTQWDDGSHCKDPSCGISVLSLVVRCPLVSLSTLEFPHFLSVSRSLVLSLLLWPVPPPPCPSLRSSFSLSSAILILVSSHSSGATRVGIGAASNSKVALIIKGPGFVSHEQFRMMYHDSRHKR